MSSPGGGRQARKGLRMTVYEERRKKKNLYLYMILYPSFIIRQGEEVERKRNIKIIYTTESSLYVRMKT